MHYTLTRMRRKTLALQIKNDGSLLVKAPLFLPLSRIESFIATKKEWILKHQKRIQTR